MLLRAVKKTESSWTMLRVLHVVCIFGCRVKFETSLSAVQVGSQLKLDCELLVHH